MTTLMAVPFSGLAFPGSNTPMATQSFNLIGDLTVWENVELPLQYREMSGAERKTRVTAALERVKMAHRKSHMPSQLSGGQQGLVHRFAQSRLMKCAAPERRG